MERNLRRPALLAAVACAIVLIGAIELHTASESRIQRGLSISPVPLDTHGKNLAQVATGSYLVNAVSGCNDCHTCPSFAHDPLATPDRSQWINKQNYLAGGVHFGPFTSANLTPDSSGRPAGLTLDEFKELIRTGHDPENGAPIFVMPWPIYSNMVDSDLEAIYAFLGSIPHAEAGACSGAGEVAPQ